MEQKTGNFTQVPNVLLENLAMGHYSAQELRVVLVVIRKTYGWGKLQDAISYSQFMEATGISRRSVARVIGNLVSSGTLVSYPTRGRTTIFSFSDVASDVESTTTSDMQGTKLVPPVSPTIETLQKIDDKLLTSISNEVVSSLASKYSIAEGDVRRTLEHLRLYCKSSGKRYKNYPAALENFILSDLEAKKIVPLGEVEEEYERLVRGDKA